MKKSKMRGYAEKIGVSVINGRVFNGKRKKISAGDAKERIEKDDKQWADYLTKTM